MQRINDFFISHNSIDKERALALYDLLKSINPDWNIFLDCSEERPLESHEEWRAKMLKEVEMSRHLIFISSDVEFLKEGNGWLYEEVSLFNNLKVTRNRRNCSQQNISYFGILFGQFDFEKDLFSDLDRGSEYRKLYDRPEHLVLEAQETVSSAAERIQIKVLTAFDKYSIENAVEILDKTRQFAENRQKYDQMFNELRICDNLLPTMLANNNKPISFDDLLLLLESQSVALIGKEGGLGKTSLLTKLFYKTLGLINLQNQDSTTMVPIYIEAKSFSAKNYLILRYIAQNLFGETTAMTDLHTSPTIGMLDREFSVETTTPRYLLLIDGYNEIPVDSIKTFENELKDFLPGGRYQNTSVVITGRNLGSFARAESISVISLGGLSSATRIQYLKDNGVWKGKIEETLFHILSVPMYLKMYVDTAGDNQIKSKADLLLKFVERQINNQEKYSNSQEQKALHRILLQHILPFIAHQLVMTNNTENDFVFTKNEFVEILGRVIEKHKDDDYTLFLGDDYLADSSCCKFSGYGKTNLSVDAAKYYAEVCEIFSQKTIEAKESTPSGSSNGMLGMRRVAQVKEKTQYEFIHQIYRDFFCAMFIVSELYYVEYKRIPTKAISEMRIEPDVIAFVCELLNDGRPVCDSTTKCWDYSCNENSIFVNLLDIARENGQGDDQTYISNLIELIKYNRSNDLSGLDLSGLDLRKSDLRTCIFTRFDSNGNYPCTFSGSNINSENLLSQNHSGTICAACLNEKYLATMDEARVLKIWDRKGGVSALLKTITDVEYDIKKMIFSNKENCILAMSSHEIIEISIPEEEFSVAKTTLVYESQKPLRDFCIDDKGNISISTIYNSFNPKPISDLSLDDEITFYGLNTCTASNISGNQLAFGHLLGYKGFKIYNYDIEKAEWIDQKIGFSSLLSQYIDEVEEAIIKFKLYKYFPREIDKKSRNGKPLMSLMHMYIIHKDTVCENENIFREMHRDISRVLASNRIKLSASQKEVISAVVDKYTDNLRISITENENLEQKKNIGETLLLQFFDEIREILKGFKIYYTCFSDSSASFFARIRFEYENRDDEYDKVPTEVYTKIIVELKKSGITLHNGQIKALLSINKKYIQSIQALQVENPLLLKASGKKINSISYRDDETLLLSCVKVREKENLYDSFVMELNTRTMKAKHIASFTGRNPLKAWYSDDCIIVNSGYRLVVFNDQGEQELVIEQNPIYAYGLLYSSDGLFYALSYQFIYRYDADGNCIGGYDNLFNSTGLVLCCDDNNKQYIADKRYVNSQKTEIRVLDVSNGEYIIAQNNLTILCEPQKRGIKFDNTQFKVCSNNLVKFENNIQVDKMEMWFKLFVYGCDFRGVRGGLVTAHNLNLLSRYGALVDASEKSEIRDSMINNEFETSQTPFTKIDFFIERPAPYNYHEGVEIVENNPFHEEISENDDAEIKTWNLIHWGFLDKSRLDSSDYSILEWVDKLCFATSKMIFELMDVSLIDKPAYSDFKKERIGERMATTLNRNYKLLFRYNFGEKSLPVFAISSPFSSSILKEAGGELQTKSLNDKLDSFTVRSIMARNQWFCLTLHRHKERVVRYGLNSVFDTDYHFSGRAKVDAYINLNGQAFFAETVRKSENEPDYADIRNKIERLCNIATYCRKLSHDGITEYFEKNPVIVIVAENYEHCAELNKHICDISPNIRKIFTFDVLLNSNDDLNNNYIEFVDEKPFVLGLVDLI